MDIITEKAQETNINTLLQQFFVLNFFMKFGNGTEWISYDLPEPNVLNHTDHGVFLSWVIDGYFGTRKNREYLNDIIARFLLTFRQEEITRLSFKPPKEAITDKTHVSTKVHKLKEFQGLKSIVRHRKPQKRSDVFKDHVFWAIKFYCEDLIIKYGIPNYQDMIEFAYLNFEYKEKSTLRAKCRSIFHWYEERNFEITTGKKKKYESIEKWYEDSRMTRTENMKKINEKRKEENRRLIINAITGLMSETYRKPNGKFNIKKISEDLDISRNTVSKYIKEFEESKKIKSS